MNQIADVNQITDMNLDFQMRYCTLLQVKRKYQKSMQPLDLRESTVPQLKDLIHICLEPEAQGHSMTFKVLKAITK